MAYVITFPLHYLEIDEIPLSTPAWEVLNLEDLESGPDVRGEPRLLPGAVGVRANPLRATVTEHTLNLYFHGSADPEGNPFDEAHAGILSNLARFRADVVSQPSVGVTRNAVLHLPDPDDPDTEGPSRTGAVQIRKLSVGEALSPDCVRATLDLIILGGSLS